jgi:hypothetical protein
VHPCEHYVWVTLSREGGSWKRNNPLLRSNRVIDRAGIGYLGKGSLLLKTQHSSTSVIYIEVELYESSQRTLRIYLKCTAYTMVDAQSTVKFRYEGLM